MPELQVGPYNVLFSCLAVSTPGIKHEPQGVAILVQDQGRKTNRPQYTLAPNASIVFRASFEVSVGTGAADFYDARGKSAELKKKMFEDCDPLLPLIEVGFVQNLMRSRRSVVYSPARGARPTRRFQETHAPLPLLDRAKASADPWYRNGKGCFMQLTTGHFNFEPADKVERFQLEVSDGPELAFVHPETQHATVDWEDHFTTCTVIRVGGTFHRLHHFAWRAQAKGPLDGIESGAGIRVLEDLYCLPPYEFPDDWKFAGELAQDSTMRLDNV
jgi:hypothetical protein